MDGLVPPEHNLVTSIANDITCARGVQIVGLLLKLNNDCLRRVTW